MVELAEERSAAAWKIKNLQDYDARLERGRAGSMRYPASALSPR